MAHAAHSIDHGPNPSTEGARARYVREVRLERWDRRAFFVVNCQFRVDAPFDMSECIVNALRDAQSDGHRRPLGGAILARDAGNRAAVFIEVEARSGSSDRIAHVGGDLLIRALPPSPPSLRDEVDELVRWSGELGHEVRSFYVGFAAGDGPRVFRPIRLLAVLDGEGVVEPFEIRSKREYYVRARASQ